MPRVDIGLTAARINFSVDHRTLMGPESGLLRSYRWRIPEAIFGFSTSELGIK